MRSNHQGAVGQMRTQETGILLVEDEANDAFLMQRAFAKTKLPNPIKVVSNGEQAIAYFSGQKPYDNRSEYPMPMLVILDLKLPRKSGIEVLAWLKEQGPLLRRVPVVVLTSSKQMSDVNRAYELGANSYLVKPVTFEGLLELVKALEMYWFAFSQQPEVVNS